MSSCRNLFLSLALGMLVSASAWATTALELEAKQRFEAAAESLARRYLDQKGMTPQDYRLLISAVVRQVRENKPQKRLEPRDPASNTDGTMPGDLTIGLIDAQRISEEVRERDRALAGEKSEIALKASVTDFQLVTIHLGASWSTAVDEPRRKAMESEIPEVLRRGLGEGVEIRPRFESFVPASFWQTWRLQDFAPLALPVSMVILLVGAFALFLLWTRRRPEAPVEGVESNVSVALEAPQAIERPALSLDPRPQLSTVSIDEVSHSDFLRAEELQRKLQLVIAEWNPDRIDSLKQMIRNWTMEGGQGLRKCVLVARAWNDLQHSAPSSGGIRTEGFQLEASPGIVQAFRDVAALSYRERSEWIERVIFELTGARAIGADGFGNRFGFLFAKPMDLLAKLISELPESRRQAMVLASLPADRRTVLLNTLSPEVRIKVLASTVGQGRYSTTELQELATELRSRCSALESESDQGMVFEDLSSGTAEVLEATPAIDTVALVAELEKADPRRLDWMKVHYFCLGLIPHLRDEGLSQLLGRLSPPELVQIALALPEGVAGRIEKMLPSMKATIFKDLLALARSQKREPDARFLDEWSARVRENLKKALQERSGLTPQVLYHSVSSSEASDAVRAA
jgi:hypothetical protein